MSTSHEEEILATFRAWYADCLVHPERHPPERADQLENAMAQITLAIACTLCGQPRTSQGPETFCPRCDR